MLPAAPATRRKVLVAGIAGAAALALAAGALSAAGDPEPSPAGARGEVRLNAQVARQARKSAEVRRAGAGRPSPARRHRSAGTRGELPPPRILRENARLRRELKDLNALQAANLKVERTLGAAGPFAGGLQVGVGGLAWPVRGTVVSPFGPRWGRLHAGIDIAAPAGLPVRAAAAGRVVISAPNGGYGNYVCVQHNGRLTTCYAHLSRLLARRGAAVEQGEAVGLVGCTGRCYGDHVQFETRVDGRPIDPMRYLAPDRRPR